MTRAVLKRSKRKINAGKKGGNLGLVRMLAHPGHESDLALDALAFGIYTGFEPVQDAPVESWRATAGKVAGFGLVGDGDAH